MKKFLFSMVAITIATFGISQSQVIFEDSFESYEDFAIENVGEWTLIDADQLKTYGFTGITFANAGAKKAFQVFNSKTTTPPLTASDENNWDGRTGDKAMVAFASVPSAGNYNDDWLISPKITLGTANNVLSFWYKGAAAKYNEEEFKVGVSTTGNTVADFTMVTDVIKVTKGDISYHEFTYNFPDEYNGKEVYIAINCISKDQFGFLVDDFKVVGEGLSVSDIAEKNTSIYPNPVKDVLNINLAESFDKSNTVINIYSAVGKKASTFKYNSTLNVSNLAKGAYVLEITDGAKTISKKFIKK